MLAMEIGTASPSSTARLTLHWTSPPALSTSLLSGKESRTPVRPLLTYAHTKAWFILLRVRQLTLLQPLCLGGPERPWHFFTAENSSIPMTSMVDQSGDLHCPLACRPTADILIWENCARPPSRSANGLLRLVVERLRSAQDNYKLGLLLIYLFFPSMDIFWLFNVEICNLFLVVLP